MPWEAATVVSQRVLTTIWRPRQDWPTVACLQYSWFGIFFKTYILDEFVWLGLPSLRFLHPLWTKPHWDYFDNFDLLAVEPGQILKWCEPKQHIGYEYEHIQRNMNIHLLGILHPKDDVQLKLQTFRIALFIRWCILLATSWLTTTWTITSQYITLTIQTLIHYITRRRHKLAAQALIIRHKRHRRHRRHTSWKCIHLDITASARHHTTHSKHHTSFMHQQAPRAHFHGGAGGANATRRKRQESTYDTNIDDFDDDIDFASALIQFATAYTDRRKQQRQAHIQHHHPPQQDTYTRQTHTQVNSHIPVTRTTKPPKAPKMNLYTQIQNAFRNKTCDPLDAITSIIQEAQQLRSARQHKWALRQQTEDTTSDDEHIHSLTHTPTNIRNKHRTHHDPLAAPPETTPQKTTYDKATPKPPRLTFTDRRTPIVGGQRLIHLLQSEVKLRDGGYAVVTKQEHDFIKDWIEQRYTTGTNKPDTSKTLVIWDVDTNVKPAITNTTPQWLPTDTGYKQFLTAPLFTTMPPALTQPTQETATTTQTSPAPDNLISVRIETYKHLTTPEDWIKRQKHPHTMVKPLFDELEIEAQCTGWRHTDHPHTEQLTGYTRLSPNVAEQLVKRSGTHAAFYSQVGSTKEQVKWITKDDNESDIAYHARVLSLAQDKHTGLAHRQGLGKSYLGLRGVEPEVKTAIRYTCRGAPSHWGPSTFNDWLTQQKWQNITAVGAPRSSKGAWHFTAQPPTTHQTNKSTPIIYNIAATDTNPALSITIEAWKPTPPRPTPDATTPLKATSKWITQLEANKPQPPPTTNHKENDNQDTAPQPTKRQKTEVTPKKPKQPPSLGPRGEPIFDLGGAGDCGWRHIAASIAFQNQKDTTYITNRHDSMAATIRTKTIQWLKTNKSTWQQHWAPDPDATQLTEQGRVPKTAEEWLDATIKRPQKWVDQYTVSAMAQATGFDILVFQQDHTHNRWTLTDRLLANPTTGKKTLPTILLLHNDHFTTIEGKPDKYYNTLNPPEGKEGSNAFHGSGRSTSSSSSWQHPPPPQPSEHSWLQPPANNQLDADNTHTINTVDNHTDTNLDDINNTRKRINGKTPNPHYTGRYPVSTAPRQSKPWTLRNKAFRNRRKPITAKREPQSWTCPECNLLIEADLNTRQDQLSRKRKHHLRTAHPELPCPDLRQRRIPVTATHSLPQDLQAWVCPICKAALPGLEERLKLDSIHHHIKTKHPRQTIKGITSKQMKAQLPPFDKTNKRKSEAHKALHLRTAIESQQKKGHDPIPIPDTLIKKYFPDHKRHSWHLLCKTCWRKIHTSQRPITCSKAPQKTNRNTIRQWWHDAREHGDGHELAALVHTTPDKLDTLYTYKHQSSHWNTCGPKATLGTRQQNHNPHTATRIGEAKHPGPRQRHRHPTQCMTINVNGVTNLSMATNCTNQTWYTTHPGTQMQPYPHHCHHTLQQKHRLPPILHTCSHSNHHNNTHHQPWTAAQTSKTRRIPWRGHDPGQTWAAHAPLQSTQRTHRTIPVHTHQRRHTHEHIPQPKRHWWSNPTSGSWRTPCTWPPHTIQHSGRLEHWTSPTTNPDMAARTSNHSRTSPTHTTPRPSNHWLPAHQH